MIILLIACLLKKYNGLLKNKAKIAGLLAPKNSALLIAFLSLGSPLISQHQTLNYKVIHNGNAVGQIQLQHTMEGSDVFIKVTSNIKMRFIMTFQVNAEEDSHYHDGKLVFSQVHRFVNGKSKINKSTKANGNSYQLSDDGKISSLNQNLINYSVSMMYLKEPMGLSLIYSDNYQKFISIKKVTDHTYRLFLPDGNYNDYSYQNGICNRVEVHTSLYTVQIQLA
jgi:hypothetical protein